MDGLVPEGEYSLLICSAGPLPSMCGSVHLASSTHWHQWKLHV